LGISDADAKNSSILIESHEAAREYGKKYKAELVIWGDVTLQGVIPNITIVNQDDVVYEVIKPETTILKDSLCHAVLATVSDIRFSALTDEPIRLVSFVTGLRYYNQGKYEKSIEYFTYSLSEEHIKYIDNSPIFFYRGTSRLYLKDYDKAVLDYNKAIEINPKYYKTYGNRGNAYFNKGMYDKAIEGYNKVIEIDIKDYLAYTNRGLAYYHKGEYDKAIMDYNKAIEINSQYYSAYINRGNTYVHKEEYGKAIMDYNKAIEINPQCDFIYTNRGITYGYKGEYDKAISDFTQAIQINPKYDHAYINRGVAYENKGIYDKAIMDYNKAIEINSKYDLIYYNRGVAYGRKGEYDKAISDFTQAIQINPKYDHAYDNRGVSYEKKGIYDKAFDDYNKVIEINSKNDLVYSNISWLLATCPDEKYRNGEKAIEFAQIALELKLDNYQILDTLAAAYAEVGKFEDAVKTQQKAIEMLNEKEKDKYLSEYTEHLNFYKANKPWREKPKSGNQE